MPRRSSPKSHAVVLLSDLHSGHALGLLNPSTTLLSDDTDPVPFTPPLTATQTWLWSNYQSDLSSIPSFLPSSSTPITVIHAGDFTHGNSHPSVLVSPIISHQVDIAVSNLSPLLSLPNLTSLRIVSGTDAHNLGFGSLERLITSAVSTTYPNISTSYTNHHHLIISSIIFDVAHHGPHPGIREWTRGNVARLYARSIAFQELARGNTPPRVIVRAHRHKPVWETINAYVNASFFRTDMIILPSYCGITSYARKVSQSSYLLCVGMFVFIIQDSHLTHIHPLLHEMDLRTEEVIP